MKSTNPAVTFIWAAVVLAAATVLGYGIRQIRWSRAAYKNLPESESRVEIVDSEPDVQIAPEPEPEPEVETVEIVAEEPAWAEPEDEPEPEVVAEPQRQTWQMGQNAGLIQKFFDDLNLNKEEQARLQEGFALMRRRFEQMSDEDRWAQFAQMAEMGQRWQNMSDEEREGVTQRMRERYEVWRHSDSIEIPQLTLD